MKHTCADGDRQLSLDFTSPGARKPGSASGGSVVVLKSFAEKKKNAIRLAALRKVLAHAESLPW